MEKCAGQGSFTCVTLPARKPASRRRNFNSETEYDKRLFPVNGLFHYPVRHVEKGKSRDSASYQIRFY